MPDLYAINLHLQERLELEWRDEVRAPEAALWLDKATLLTDRNTGLPLCALLRAGHIAGQEQRPNKKNGAWFIQRLAKSRHPNAIRDARVRLLRSLPIDRAAVPTDWPVNQGPAIFWQEFGKTIAAFGYLERILASTCFALLFTPEKAFAFVHAGHQTATSQWVKGIMKSQVNPMGALTCKLNRGLREDGRVPHTVRENLISKLSELLPWRNALCHGAWISIDKDGSGHLEHPHLEEGVPVSDEQIFTLNNLSDLRARTVDITFRIAEIASITRPATILLPGAGYELAPTMPRMYKPQHAQPELK